MLVRKFEAEDMARALKQVKETLGADALILSTRTLRKKGLGVLGKQTVEVTAAIESPAMKSNPPSAPQQEIKKSTVAGPIPVAYQQRFETLEDELVSLPPETPQKVERSDQLLEEEVRSLRSQLEAQNVGHLQSEINQLKELVQQLAQAPEQRPAEVEPVVEEAPPVVAAEVKSEAPAPRPVVAKFRPAAEDLQDIAVILTERGIDPEAASTIARFAAQQMTDRQRQEPQLCHDFLTRMVADLVHTSGPLWQPGEAQKRISLIGPTGVGKTTTIAKLAAQAMTEAGARVALVTIDTYRIAAVEQLKIYAEIMGLPVEVVISPDQLQEAFRRHRDKDLILIDTAGRSPRDAAQIDELSEFLGAGSEVENCLVLAAPTDERLQEKSYSAFSKLPISKLIFTKLDETDRCGSLLNLPTRVNLPLAYLTNGQQVPEDLLLAEPANVAEWVMGADVEAGRLAV